MELGNVRNLTDKFSSAISLTIALHAIYPKKRENKVRKHDGITPFYVHPIGMALWILEDNNGIDFATRFLAANIALFHDILEDTTITKEDLKVRLESIYGDKDFVDKIIYYIDECTIVGSSRDEYNYLRENEKFIDEIIWYVKLVDKIFNLFGSIEMFAKKNKLRFYIEFLEYLKQQVVKTRKFCNSMFISMANMIITKAKKHCYEYGISKKV